MPALIDYMGGNSAAGGTIGASSNLGVETNIPGVSSVPVGGTYRGIGSSWFNSADIAREDWLRGEQAANNDYARNLSLQKDAQNFSEYMMKNQYQMTVEDMKKAGINPILAYSQGSSSVPSVSSPGTSHSRGSYRSGSNDDISRILGLLAGLITTAATQSAEAGGAVNKIVNQSIKDPFARSTRGSSYYLNSY